MDAEWNGSVLALHRVKECIFLHCNLPSSLPLRTKFIISDRLIIV